MSNLHRQYQFYPNSDNIFAELVLAWCNTLICISVQWPQFCEQTIYNPLHLFQIEEDHENRLPPWTNEQAERYSCTKVLLRHFVSEHQSFATKCTAIDAVIEFPDEQKDRSPRVIIVCQDCCRPPCHLVFEPKLLLIGWKTMNRKIQTRICSNARSTCRQH